MAGIDLKAAAAALGRRGGLRGGPARAEALSDQQRKDAASEAANVRWHGEKNPNEAKKPKKKKPKARAA